MNLFVFFAYEATKNEVFICTFESCHWRSKKFVHSKEEDDPRWSNVFDDNTLSSSIQSVTGINCQFARCLYDAFGRIFFTELNFRIYLYSVYHVCCWTQWMKRRSYFYLTPVTVDTIRLWTIEISWPAKYLKKHTRIMWKCWLTCLRVVAKQNEQRLQSKQ